MKPKQTFLDFCRDLQGYHILKGDKVIPKYISYWSGHDSRVILSGNSKIKLIKRVCEN